MSTSGERRAEPGRAHVTLIGNYAPDRQESMLRFARLLAGELAGRGWPHEVLAPRRIFARSWTPPRLAKWLAYLDKFVVFPLVLRRHLARPLPSGTRRIVHVCDHSNAPYVLALSPHATLVTCHDLLAVRGARGEDTDCPASRFGRALQQMILAGLQRADFVACDSTATRSDLLRLGDTGMEEKSEVILLGQNHPYQRLEAAAARERLARLGLTVDEPFLLHVGSDLRRKNRASILRVLAELGAGWTGRVVFAGETLGREARGLMHQLGLAPRVTEIAGPANETLEALYSLAFALLYPSRCEGFGWPVIEAQACGCPVIASTASSLPEVAGAAAFLHEPQDVHGMAQAVHRLEEPEVRNALVTAGFANAERFRVNIMTEKYVRLYDSLARPPGGTRPRLRPAVLHLIPERLR